MRQKDKANGIRMKGINKIWDKGGGGVKHQWEVKEMLEAELAAHAWEEGRKRVQKGLRNTVKGGV